MEPEPQAPRRRWRRVAAIAGAAALGGLLTLGLLQMRDPTIGPTPLDGSEPLPAVAGVDLDGRTRISVQALRGKPVFINAWASWCGPCRDEAPDIARFVKDHPEIAMIGLNVNNDRGDARAFEADVRWTHPSIYDPHGAIGLDVLGIAQLPSTIYVDASGRVRGSTSGPVTYAMLADIAARIR